MDWRVQGFGPEGITVGRVGVRTLDGGFWGWGLPKLSNIWNFWNFAVVVRLWSMFKSFWVIVIFCDPGPVLSMSDFRERSLRIKCGCSFW